MGYDGKFLPSDEPRLPPRNRFLRHSPTLPPSAPDFATAIGVLPARHRQRPDPPQHLAKQAPVQMSLGQQQPVVPGVLDQSPKGIDGRTKDGGIIASSGGVSTLIRWPVAQPAVAVV